MVIHPCSQDPTLQKEIPMVASPSKRMRVSTIEEDEDNSPIFPSKRSENLTVKRKIAVQDDEEEWICSDSDNSIVELSDDSEEEQPTKRTKKRLQKSTTNKKVVVEVAKPPTSKPIVKPVAIASPSPDVSAQKYSPFFSSTPVSQPLDSGYNYVTPTPSTVKPTPESSQSPESTPSNLIPLPEGVMGRGTHEHNSFPFLLPANRRDKAGKKMSDQDYNPRTLFIPDSFLKEQTPAMLQWWQFKSENMDTILFFKV